MRASAARTTHVVPDLLRAFTSCACDREIGRHVRNPYPGSPFVADTSSTPSHAVFVPDIDLLDQHFLTDASIADACAAAAGIANDDVVADLGAGAGILTRAALDHQPRRVVAVEIDQRCRRWLTPLAAANPTLTLVWADLRTANAAVGSTTVVVANPPFTLMHHVVLLLRALPRLRTAVLVAGRRWARAVTAAPGSREFRRTSLHVQSRFAVERLGQIDGKAFHPAVAGHAEIVRLNRIEPDPLLDLLAEADLYRAAMRVKDVWRPRAGTVTSILDRLKRVRHDPAVRALQQLRLQRLTSQELSRLVAAVHSTGSDPATGSPWPRR